MADMCGPSNALQNFQKHSTVDRTLQQDRLISRQSPSQGFRSAPPNARHFDPEFEAFQTGNLPLDQTFSQPPLPFQQPFQQAGQSVNWASDFQRLNISHPPPQQQHTFPTQRQQDSSWHHEFSRQNQIGGSSIAQGNKPLYNDFSRQGLSSFNHSQIPSASYGDFGYSYHTDPPMEGAQHSQTHQDNVFDDAAFEAAFQQAAKEAQAEAEALQAETTLTQEAAQSQHLTPQQETTLLPQTLDQTLSTATPVSNNPLEQPLIGADTIHDPNKPDEEQHGNEDPGELARTAQRLVDSLSGDSRQKLQESEFMKLMRGFAGGEKRIVGDEVVGRGDVKVEG